MRKQYMTITIKAETWKRINDKRQPHEFVYAVVDRIVDESEKYEQIKDKVKD